MEHKYLRKIIREEVRYLVNESNSGKIEIEVKYFDGRFSKTPEKVDTIMGKNFTTEMRKAKKVAKSLGYSYVEFHHQGSHVCSLLGQYGYEFTRGDDYKYLPWGFKDAHGLLKYD